MSRNIVLLSDGTGNSAAKVWRTNVWRTFEALDLSGNDQVAFYDDGVGTSSFKPWAILGGAFGFGLKRNVVDIYKFACRNYRDEDDRIYGFGFSRGAFTIRVVIGLILNQGLVWAQDEAELDKKANAAYRQYRRERYHTMFRIEDVFRWFRDLFLSKDYDKADNRPVETIRFIGVWDTVAAYGAPLDEMTRGISQYIWPLELPHHTLGPRAGDARLPGARARRRANHVSSRIVERAGRSSRSIRSRQTAFHQGRAAQPGLVRRRAFQRRRRLSG